MATMSKIGALLIAAGIVFGLAGCPPPPPPGPPAGFANADLERGGSLYDKWWVVNDTTAPTTDHPLWSTQTADPPNARTGADTWRCKECHGWDYKGAAGAYAPGGSSHATGFAGISGAAGVNLRTKSIQSVFDTIGDAAHAMTDLTEADIWDLTKFVIDGQLDTADILDANNAFIGTAASGATTYASTCAGCHGVDGLMEVVPGFTAGPGFLSNDNPAEFQHKVSYGHPATAMPPQVNILSVAQIGDLGAFSQTLPTTAPNLVRGGTLYDKWWTVTGADAPTTDHPLWATQTADPPNARTGGDTWRCKECHGWDYIGVLGRYSTGSHKTGFAGIENVSGVVNRSKTSVDVADVIRTGHGYGDVMTNADIWNLTEFVLNGQLDMSAIMDANGAFIGNATTGKVDYDNICSGCHGLDGLADFGTGFDTGPGFLSNDNPQEFQHKVSYGHPGTGMPAQVENLTVAEIGDLGAHAQTLPTSR